ncbi:MAG: lactate utilization protein [Burkholderiales bacterium]|nr:lactate utilization protein [Burkholderiales bacterium]
MNTSKARSAILQRLRDAQQRPASEKEAEIAAARAYLQQHAAGPQPALGGAAQAAADGERAALIAYFCQQALKMGDTLAQVPTLDAVPAEVARYLQENALPPTMQIWPQFASLAWQAAGVEISLAPAPRSQRMDYAQSLTGAFCAVAETGSLLLTSSVATPVSSAILPETHIAIVQESRIVAYMEQAFTLLQAEQAEQAGLPRTATFISGPSRTGDIEQTIVLGAHGPYRVHVILIPN